MTNLERAWTAEQNLAAMTLRYEMANQLNISARQELTEVKGFLLTLPDLKKQIADQQNQIEKLQKQVSDAGWSYEQQRQFIYDAMEGEWK